MNGKRWKRKRKRIKTRARRLDADRRRYESLLLDWQALSLRRLREPTNDVAKKALATLGFRILDAWKRIEGKRR